MSAAETTIQTLVSIAGKWLDATSAADVVETSDRLTLEGAYFAELSALVDELLETANKLKVGKAIGLRFDGSEVSRDNLDSFRHKGQFILKKWRLSLNKEAFLDRLPKEPFQFLLFFSEKIFKKWLKGVRPFDAKSVVNQKSPLKIIVRGLGGNFGGEQLQFLDAEKISYGIELSEKQLLLPSDEKVKEEVHVIATNIQIEPLHFKITHYSGDEKTDHFLSRNYLMLLGACIVHEFYGADKIVLKGYKRIALPLVNKGDEHSIESTKLLEEVVHWIYAKDIATKVQLLAERLSLEIISGTSFLKILETHLQDAFVQAKNQYQAVIQKRKDAYFREKRDLLNELQSQAKTYSEKLRSLLGGLIRDVLAAIFLVGFGLFSKTKMPELAELMTNRFTLLLFKGLGIYFLLSFILQLVINLTDLRISRKEVDFWASTTRNYLSKREVKEIIAASTKRRRLNFTWFYILIGLIYFGIALFCWNLKGFFDWLQ